MRTRRRFQPMLDVLTSRIAPSAIGVIPQPALAAAGASVGHLVLPTCQPDDSDMPETGDLNQLILGPVPSTPPPTLLC